MSTSSETPTYNLKAVVQETGLKADTLRAWERRYGLPEPLRTPSGHRLYSRRDIDTLKWLIGRQEEGLSISRAVALWERLEADASDPLAAMQNTAMTKSEPPSHPAISGPQVASSRDITVHDSVLHNSNNQREHEVEAPTTVQATDGNQGFATRQQWLAACFAFDEQAARRVIEQAFSLFSPELVCTEVLQGGLATIGEAWERGQVTAQQEHFASSLAMSHVQALLNSTPQPTRPGRILVGCPAGEEHVFPALLLTLFLRRKGWDIVFLGANVPRRSLEKTLIATLPNLVILVAQQLHTAASLSEMAQILYDRRIPMAYGGRVFGQLPEIQESIAGHFLGNDLVASIQIVENIMQMPRSRKAVQDVAGDSTQTQRYREARPLIEAQVWQKLQALGKPLQPVSDANMLLGRTLLAHLSLKTSTHSRIDLSWVEQLLTNHYQMTQPQVEIYLNTYADALAENLQEAGVHMADQLISRTPKENV